MRNDLAKISKYLSYILRHQPDSIKIKLDEEGWANLDELIKNAKKYDDMKLNIQTIKEVVETNDKKRFSLSSDETKIRANQGHSIKIDLKLEEKEPPQFLYHGTATRFLHSIKKSGIKKMNRHHVHLSKDKKTAEAVGKRHGKIIVLIIDSLKMYNDGHKFYLSENGVWLTEHIDPKYIIFEDN